jgi:hypothetical protein
MSSRKEATMQPWQMKALELEVSGLKHLDGFIHGNALGFFIGAIYLLLALLAWVLCGALRRKGGKLMFHIRPAVFIHLSGPPPPHPDTLDPFPPPHHSAHCDHDDDWD